MLTVRLTFGPEVIKVFSCSTQLNLNFKVLITIKIAYVYGFFISQSFILLIESDVKMPTMLAYLTL